jgi:hypothetical protein
MSLHTVFPPLRQTAAGQTNANINTLTEPYGRAYNDLDSF